MWPHRTQELATVVAPRAQRDGCTRLTKPGDTTALHCDARTSASRLAFALSWATLACCTYLRCCAACR